MGKRWTLEEIDILKKEYANDSTSNIALKLNKTVRSVYAEAHILGLKKSNEFLQSDKCGRLIKGSQIGKATQFKKGLTPFNKGIKGLTIANKTSFKKGHIPHNTKWDGAERVNVDGYVEVRISLGVYKLKHRLVWEQANGPIPEGYNIQFKDGNRQNIELSNLELVSKCQNMEQNSLHRYPAEVKTAIRTLAKLKNNIKKYETN